MLFAGGGILLVCLSVCRTLYVLTVNVTNLCR